MKKMYNNRYILLLSSIIFLVTHYVFTDATPIWFSIIITLIIIIILSGYTYLIYKFGDESVSKSLPKIFLIVLLISIVFLRTYFEGNVLDYKFNVYNKVDNLSSGAVSDVTKTYEESYPQNYSEIYQRAESRIGNQLNIEDRDSIHIRDYYKSGDDYYYYTKIFDIHYIIKLVDDELLTEQYTIEYENDDAIDDIMVVGEESDEVYYMSRICENSEYDNCSVYTLYSIDKENNITEHFQVFDTYIDDARFRDNNLYLLTSEESEYEGNTKLRKYDMSGEVLIETQINYYYINNDNNINVGDNYVHVVSKTRSVSIINSYNLDFEHIDGIIFNQSEVNFYFNRSVKTFNVIIEDEYYYIEEVFSTTEIKRMNDSVYYNNKNNVFYRSGILNSAGDSFEYAKLMKNPIIVIAGFLLSLIVLVDYYSFFFKRRLAKLEVKKTE